MNTTLNKSSLFQKKRIINEINKLRTKYTVDINEQDNTLLVRYNKNFTFVIQIYNSYPFMPCNYGIIIHKIVLLSSLKNKLPFDIINNIQKHIKKEIYIKNIKELFINNYSDNNDLNNDTRISSVFNYDDIIQECTPATFIVEVLEKIIELFIKYKLFTILF